jgi:hypothetical protein
MKKTLFVILFLGSLLPLPAAIEPFARGQLFISAYAGFVPAPDGGWDVMYNLCFESAISRNVSIGFAYSQKQSHSGESQDQLVIPLTRSIAAGSQPDAAPGKLAYSDLTTRLFCLEGKIHFALAAIRRLDLFCGAGFGLELNKINSLEFVLSSGGSGSSASELQIRHVDSNHYYLVANFFGGASFYLADDLAFSAKAGYQYSGISDYDIVLSAGITFRIR